jgi:EAL domain-containing protein (putative c-di-GMP-specific phosphodiesterase class I)
MGRNCVALFDEQMHEQVVSRLELENDLRQAIRRDELRAFYQPLFDLRTGELTGFEALVRWQHHGRGLLLPDQFIPIAEGAGLVDELDKWMLRAACRSLGRWQAEFGLTERFILTVNLSCRHQHLLQVGQFVERTLAEYGVSPASMGLEITESALAVAEAELLEQLLELRQLGVRLYLDDFGTGYSSLSRLHGLPIDVLKLDRAFVSNIDHGDVAFAQAIIGLAHSLGMQVVAEGIETGTQRDRLCEFGCEFGQGFLYSKPLPERDADHLLREAYARNPKRALAAASIES